MTPGRFPSPLRLAPPLAAAFFDQRTGADTRSVSALGLAFSKLLIETHGGRIWIESAESQGTTYAFSLPVAK